MKKKKKTFVTEKSAVYVYLHTKFYLLSAATDHLHPTNILHILVQKVFLLLHSKQNLWVRMDL